MKGQSVGRPAVEWPHVLDGFFGAALERQIKKHPAVTFLVAALAVTLTERVAGGSLSHFDRAYVAAVLTLALALPPAFRLLDMAARTSQRLADRHLLHGSWVSLSERTNRTADVVGRVLAPVLAAAMLLAFRSIQPWRHPMVILLACVAAFLAGRAIGVGVSIALLGRRIERGPWSLDVQPGNVDGAAGLKPVGDLFFRLAMILAIPAVWLSLQVLGWFSLVAEEGWGAIFEGMVSGGGWSWSRVYLTLLVAVIGLEFAAFIVPMVRFHRLMVQRKYELEREADHDSLRLYELEEQLPTIRDDAQRRSIEDQIERIREHSLRIEQMPTWPVDAAVRRRFTVRNAILLAPVVANLFGLAARSEFWDSVGGVMGG